MRITKWTKFWVRFLRWLPFTEASNRQYERRNPDPDLIFAKRLNEFHEKEFNKAMVKHRRMEMQVKMIQHNIENHVRKTLH